MLEVRDLISAVAPPDDARVLDDAGPRPSPTGAHRRDPRGRAACGAAAAALSVALAALVAVRPDGRDDTTYPTPITGPIAAEADDRAP